MFMQPDATMIPSPSFGLPAVTSSSWNAYCRMKNGSEIMLMEP